MHKANSFRDEQRDVYGMSCSLKNNSSLLSITGGDWFRQGEKRTLWVSRMVQLDRVINVLTNNCKNKQESFLQDGCLILRD